MLVDRPQPDRAPPGSETAPPQRAREAQREHRGAHRLHEIVGRDRPRYFGGTDFDPQFLVERDGDAHLAEAVQHRGHVAQVRDVLHVQRLARKQRRTQDRTSRVLCAGYLDFAFERNAAFDDQLVHARSTLPTLRA